MNLTLPDGLRARLHLPTLPALPARLGPVVDRLPGWLPGRSSGPVVVPDRLSIFDPVDLGADEYGARVSVMLAYRNLLIGGEPGGGKSNGIQSILGHAALCPDVRLYLFDGKEVELPMWEPLAEWFVGPDTDEAIAVLEMLRSEMTACYARLRGQAVRKVDVTTGGGMALVVIDELALYSSTFGTGEQQKQFNRLLRDLIARGRAAGVIVVAATQRPSADVIPTSLRDLFAFRWALRCSTAAASDIILGESWASQGFTATDIDPADSGRGIGYLLAEGGIPRRFKAARLTDADIAVLVAAGLTLRSGGAR
ncbi:MAG: cell division protein FtsK [Pseudonocardiales bacterium]|nr:MAG: cell division protein FtsK [Pseudonocardiales bacterium]